MAFIVGWFESASLSQNGTLPADAAFIQMRVGGSSDPANLDVRFAGQVIPLTSVAVYPQYTLYAGDIAGFAGQTGELRLTANADDFHSYNSFLLDLISFSVPEPTVSFLFSIGVIMLAFWSKKPAWR